MLTLLGTDGLTSTATGYRYFLPQLQRLGMKLQGVVRSDCCLHGSPNGAAS